MTSEKDILKNFQKVSKISGLNVYTRSFWVEDEILYFASKDGYFVKINTKLSKVIWKEKIIGNEPRYVVIDKINSTNDLVFPSNNKFYQYSSDGKSSVFFETKRRILRNYILDEKMIFFTEKRGSVFAYDFDKDQIKWELTTRELGKKVLALGVSPELILISNVTKNGRNSLIAVNKEDGNVKWRYMYDGLFCSNPFFKNGNVILGIDVGRFPDENNQSKIVSLSIENGNVVWELDFNYSSFDLGEFPKSDGKNLYVQDTESYFYALDLMTGKVNWKYKINDPIANFEICKNKVYVSTVNSNFYSLNPTNGFISEEFSFNYINGLRKTSGECNLIVHNKYLLELD
jgi:outer membrane protein assembly factor BamB